MTKVFQISLPRSRSTVFYELIKGYQNSLGLQEVEGHPELFLEYGRNMEMHDIREDKKFMSEMYPIIKNDRIIMHYVYPYILENSRNRNLYKLNLLKEQKSKGIEYYIKGTLNLTDTIKEISDFFHDRKIIITSRKNLIDAEMSFYFAWTIKLFHARKNNVDRYKELLEKGVEVDVDLVDQYKPFLEQLKTLTKFFDENNINYDIVYHEDTESKDQIEHTISNILQTEEWKKYAKWEKLPIFIEKDYKKLILNYDEILERSLNFKI